MTDNTHSPAADDGILRWRGALLLALALTMSALLLAGLGLRAVTEPGHTNSYALLADAFLHGRLYVTECFDVDCAFHDGRNWIIFPPVPAVVAMPFVALFGTSFSGFIPLAIAFTAFALVLWWRILTTLSGDRDTVIWLVLAFAFASPLYYVTIRGDGVWFFAQTVAFLFVTVAIHEVVRGGSLVLAGVMIGLAMLCRQMSVFYLPFLFALALKPDEPLFSFRWPHWRRALALGLPVAAALCIYFLYNYVRFGSPTDTGYGYMMPADPGDETMVDYRLADHGLFSSAYFIFNALYLFVQGFHVQFAGPAMTVPEAVDSAGTSLFAASPFVLLALFVPMRRAVVIGLVMIAVMVVPMLFYHSNGFSQYNVQRYTLDWLPILFVMLAFALSVDRQKAGLLAALKVLVTYAIALNVVTMAMLALTT